MQSGQDLTSVKELCDRVLPIHDDHFVDEARRRDPLDQFMRRAPVHRH